MEPEQNSKKRQIIAALAVLIVIVAIVAGASIANKKNDDDAANTASTSQTKSSTDTATDTTSDTTDAATDTSSSSSSYKDGTYSASGSYQSPGGTESITVSVTLQDGVVTATSATSGANDPEAKEYQSDFISGYKQLVVGKSIDAISLSRVSGSSLTSQGFNSALDKIKSEAQSA